MRTVGFLLVTLILVGCNLSPAEIQAMSQSLDKINNDINYRRANPLYDENFQAPKVQTQAPTPSYDQSTWTENPDGSTTYMVNTPSGIVQFTCKGSGQNAYCF